ncbi:MAG: hypothetical protein KGL48_17140 [Sphingomonadales bacterium]|nr:hypothetical protein [Sphingomonadales bacterium]MDE2567707.1 hypothetical protein [Sphingomonadales bacterium]
MSTYIAIVDLFCLVLTVCGFSMAFRQGLVRRMFDWPPPGNTDSADPLTYILRIAGVMIMVFGFAFGMMVTLAHFA